VSLLLAVLVLVLLLAMMTTKVMLGLLLLLRYATLALASLAVLTCLPAPPPLRFADYEGKAKELEEKMSERHQGEVMEFQAKMAEKLSHQRVKFSKQLLDMRRIQETLARQKEYAEAHKTKMKADQMEAMEIEQFRDKEAGKNVHRESMFIQKQKQELSALRKRIQTGRDELKKQRQLELERLLQRYQNVKNELESQQNIERLRADKYLMKTLFPQSTRRATGGGGSPKRKPLHHN